MEIRAHLPRKGFSLPKDLILHLLSLYCHDFRTMLHLANGLVLFVLGTKYYIPIENACKIIARYS